ncbi:cytochrome c oxidase subunit 3 [Mangrovivirga sp. M17]|uniref:Cytochrome c oxidase subunit 3 n=1 Tax=Mangrovivirga halotolerans TaxID=2993936 RepID=A0ABT3RL81_9BACT|nr:cytochrome c oxidase subunit 3 [Mangrovivirga halotolerans]MCX2742577.1 cytochrome c oxidase subunit 3 [Mangrovivirga halotolerans]
MEKERENMEEQLKITRESKGILNMHPQKFAMWLFMLTVLMIFAAYTSAYIVRKGQGSWIPFDLPVTFLYSTGIIVLSSIFMQIGYFEAKKNNKGKVILFTVLTLLSGIAFLVMQFKGYGRLVDMNLYFSDPNNVSGSFIYVITGVHAAHLISALVFLIIVLITAFKVENIKDKLVRMEICTTYWHFLGGLWIYLYLFLQLNQ